MADLTAIWGRDFTPPAAAVSPVTTFAPARSEEERIRDALRFIDPTDRETWYRIGTAIQTELGEDGFALWNTWSQQAGNYDPKDAKHVWKSLEIGKVNVGTIFFEARQKGWCDSGTYQRPSPSELEARRREAEEARRKAEAEHERGQAEAREKAAVLWAEAAPCAAHPYLLQKGIEPHGARISGDALLIPMRDADGVLWSVQSIAQNGDKRFMAGGRVTGCHYAIGDIDGADAVCIAEGFATGASIREATGLPVAVAFNAGNLRPVAQALRQKFPGVKLILCGDVDRSGTGQKAAHEAAQAVGGLVALPPFTPEELTADKPPSDFNDLRALRGLEAVQAAIDSAAARVEPHPVQENAPEPFIKDAPPTPWPSDCMPPSMARAAEAIAEHVQAPAALAGLAVLGAVAHVAMHLVDARHPKKGALPASLYILTALESGGRKSECFSLATAPIAKIERLQREAHRAEIKRLEDEAARSKPKERAAILRGAPPDPRTVFVDTTTQAIEHAFVNNSAPALSLSTDEGGTLLGGHSLKSETRAASLGSLTRLFDGAGVQRDRIGEGQSGFRFGVRFGLFLSAQPIVLVEALSDPLLRGQGFLPRFIYAAPASLAGTRFHDEHTLSKKPADDLRLVAYWHTLEAMCKAEMTVDEHGGLLLPTVGMSAEAVSVWLEFYNSTERQQSEGGEYAHMPAFASRAGELAARVAAVFACWRCVESGADLHTVTATGEEMRQAAALVAYSLAEWRRHGAGSELNHVERDARDLLEWLHRKGWDTATRVKLGQHCPNALRKDTRRRNEAIDELIRRGWLIETAGAFAVVKNEKTESAPAVAVSAVFAVCHDGEETAKTAKTATAAGHLSFSPEQPKAKAFAIDVPGTLAALLGTVEVDI